MKLEISGQYFPDYLSKEFDLASYLEMFNLDIPIVGYKILTPLKRENAISHFALLDSYLKEITTFKEKSEQSLNIYKKLPNLENILPFFKQEKLEQYHLYLLGQFCKNAIEISTENVFEELHKNLLKYFNSDFSVFLLSEEQKSIKEKIDLLGHEIGENLNDIESEIQKLTGLKFIYPYPKIISEDALFEKVKNCHLLKITQKDSEYIVDFNLPDREKELISQKESLLKKYTSEFTTVLAKINQEVSPLHNDFVSQYNKLKEQIFYFSLAWVAYKNQLACPSIALKQTFKLKNGILPSLKRSCTNLKYTPLTIDLSQGANVIFGANMAGKTTVIKTVYFQLQLVRLGLPVPAQKLTLSFPENIYIHLRTSGHTVKHISSFGEEMEFLCQPFDPNSFILIDELLHSTNPISGTHLSKAFIDYFTSKQLIFLCNTHYLEIVSHKGIHLYKMNDIEYQNINIDQLQLNKELLLSKLPYTLAKINSEQLKEAMIESNKPLLISMHFNLPEIVDKQIRTIIKDSYGTTNAK